MFFYLLLILTLSAATPATQTRVEGLKAPVEILVDRWGVPHIYAKSIHDGYFAQGYQAASERLWQMDLWRKRGLGRLSEDFGTAFAEQDRAARLLLYHGDMEVEWQSYVPEMKAILEAFTAGVNARVRMTWQNQMLLPWEFRFMKTKPALWQAEDLLRIRSAALASNVPSEVERARLACRAGTGSETLQRGLTLPWSPQVPEGVDWCSIPADVLKVFNLGRTTTVNFMPKQRGGVDVARQVESNNWAIAAGRSATGRAILATDPHRPFSIPSFRYFAHVSAPGLNVIGFGEPQHPGFVFGHNEAIAWGQTTFQVDMMDLYVYETQTGKPNSYRYRDGWREMTVVKERIAGREVELKYTQHGPVVYEDAGNRRAYAVRAAWLEPGGATFMGSVGFARAANWNDFQGELERYRVPGNNVIYADVRGNVGLAPVGNAPVRKNWDGLLPVPGDGRYEWDGIRKNSQLPRLYNPTEGFVASANNAPYFVEPAKLAAMKIGYEFGEARIERIREALAGDGKISFDAAMALQNDYTVVGAKRLLPSLHGVNDAKLGEARRLLEAWDRVLRRDSAAGALYELWTRELTVAQSAAHETGVPIESWLGQLTPEKRAEAVRVTLQRAVTRAEELMGTDWKQWQWGKLHRLVLDHPLSPLVDPAMREKINVAGTTTGKGGNGNTVGNLGYDAATFQIRSGNSSRFVIDVGNWDASRFLHVPGQSGDPESAEYKNLLESWVREEYHPLLYSRKAVTEATVRRLVLRP